MIAVIVAIQTWQPQVSAADRYYLQFVNHCFRDGERFLRVYQANEDGTIDATKKTTITQSNCESATITVVGYTSGRNALTEHGEVVGTLTAATTITYTGGADAEAWSAPLAVLVKYAGISTLILSVLPIINSAGFLGVSAANIFGIVRGGLPGGMGVGVILVATIGALIISIIAMNLGPPLLLAVDGMYSTLDGRLGIMKMFGTIIRLIVEFIPVIFTTGLLAIFGVSGAATWLSMRRGGSSRGGGMMMG